MRTSHLFVAALGGVLSLNAHGAVTGLRWVEVDNTVVDPSSDPIDGAAWLANPAGWRTFDLMVLADPGDRLQSFYFGDAARPDLDDFEIYTDGQIFNHTLGGNLLVPDGPIFDFAPLLQFDTFAGLGDLDKSASNSGPVTFNLTDGLTGLNGAVSTISDIAPVFGEDGMLRVLRLTVSADFSYLGNFNAPDGLISEVQIFYFEPGEFTNTEVNLLLPTVIPAPGTASGLALAGHLFVRRRRAS